MMITTEQLRKWFGWGMLALFIFSILMWFITRETLPREIRIATAKPGGLYYKFAHTFKPYLKRQSGRDIVVLETEGTVENRDLLLTNDSKKVAQLAILQAGACDMAGISALAPLYYDVMHVVVRKKSKINSMTDLKGKNVSLGPKGSGMRKSAVQILEHYHIDIKTLNHTEEYFLSLSKESKMDAAIVTTGMPNPDLGKLLISGKFKLIPIMDAKALNLKHSYFSPIEVPRGLFAPNVPNEPVPTVATTAFLAARNDASPLLVETILTALYTGYQPLEHPTVVPVHKSKDLWTIPFHPAAIDYRDPHRGIDLLGKFLEGLAALKELVFAFAVMLYLLWSSWLKLKEREEEVVYLEQKKELDSLMNETIRIERAHMETSNPQQLRTYLDEVNHIKIKALEELTNDRLRGNQMFSIFLSQCASVIRKIQEKCIFHMENQKTEEQSNSEEA